MRASFRSLRTLTPIQNSAPCGDRSLLYQSTIAAFEKTDESHRVARPILRDVGAMPNRGSNEYLDLSEESRSANRNDAPDIHRIFFDRVR